MTLTHRITEAQAHDFNLTIRAALAASRQAGYAQSSYVHDHHTHEPLLNRRREAAEAVSTVAERAMWIAFYDVMSRPADADPTFVEPVADFTITPPADEAIHHTPAGVKLDELEAIVGTIRDALVDEHEGNAREGVAELVKLAGELGAEVEGW